MGELEGKAVVVVGASSGIGRAVAVCLAEAGADVIAAARSRESLDEMEQESDGKIRAVWCDVRQPEACESVIDETISLRGRLDALVYCAGVSPLRALVDADDALWRDVLETNLIGPNLVCRAAIPHLREARGTAVFLGSSSVGRPFPGLVAYAASKAALAESIAGWRAENPDVAFTSLVVGPTGDTGFTGAWDQDLAAEMFPFWQQRGYLAASSSMLPSEVGHAVCSVLSSPVSVHSAWIEACDRDATRLR